jgi:hypothetical protein
MEHKVEMVAVLRNGKVYHNTISVKCADRNKAIGKARRMLELWKGADNIVSTFGYFTDSEESREAGEAAARLMLREAQERGQIGCYA